MVNSKKKLDQHSTQKLPLTFQGGTDLLSTPLLENQGAIAATNSGRKLTKKVGYAMS